MALFKDDSYFKQSDSADFDKLHQPGQRAPFAGIYKCVTCGHEIGIAFNHELPPQIHAQHDPKKGKIEWKLIAFAQHNSEPAKKTT